MSLAERTQRQLRGLGHKLKPIVIIGNHGLTDAVCQEARLALAHHELIKVRVNAADRASRETIIGDLCAQTQATLVHKIGHIILLYLRNPERPKILP